MTIQQIGFLIEKVKYNPINKEDISYLQRCIFNDKDVLISSLISILNQREKEQGEKIDSLNRRVDYLLHERYSKSIETAKLRNQLEQLQREKEALQNLVSHKEAHKELMKSGTKLAYKEQADISRVYELHKQGYSKKEIAQRLNISLGTVYNRFKEIEKIAK